MSLQRDPHPLADEIGGIDHVLGEAAEHDRQRGRGGDRFKFGRGSSDR